MPAGTRPGRAGPGSGSGAGAGPREEGVVPLAVEGGALDDAVLQVLHPAGGDLDAPGVVAVVADGGAFQSLAGHGGGDPGDGVVGGHQGPGPPGAGDVAEQAVLDLVPLAGAGRQVANRNGQFELVGQLLKLDFP